MLSPGSITNSVPDPDVAIRLQRDTQRAAQEQASATSLQQSQIGAGGLLINGGGSLTISGGGSLNVGSGALNSAGSITAGTTIAAGGALSGASVAVTGLASSATSSTTGNAAVGGTSTLGPINSTYSRGHTVLSSYAVAYWDGNGDAGINISTVVSKQDITPADLAPEVQAILALALVNFRYIAAVEEHGDSAPVEIGAIAEYVEAMGLGQWVFRDAEGAVQGISYERLTIPLIAVVQSLDKRLKALEAR